MSREGRGSTLRIEEGFFAVGTNGFRFFVCPRQGRVKEGDSFHIAKCADGMGTPGDVT